MSNPIINAINQVAQEKKISKEEVLAALEKALASAYRKDFGEPNQNIVVKFDPQAFKIEVFDEKTVVEDIDKNNEQKEKRKINFKTEIPLSEAKKIKKDAKVGDVIRQELPTPSNFGRIAAQTAKQVIIQRLRESERERIYNTYKAQEGKIIDGVIQRAERGHFFVDIGDTLARFPYQEQVPKEKYKQGQKMKFYVLSVEKTPRGPEIILSRRHQNLVKELFALEIPEIADGKVEIKAISRLPGERSKVAVYSKEQGIDPIGAAIGQRGIRIQSIINELRGEKIDVVEYSEDPEKFIANALSPGKVNQIILEEKEKKAKVKVLPDQFSLVIGRQGQNVRLASLLTGWQIEAIQEQGEEEQKQEQEEKQEEQKQEKEQQEQTKEEEKKEGDKKKEKEKKEKENKSDEKNKKENKKEKGNKTNKGK